MTTPEPPGEPTPPSFEKPAADGSPYDADPFRTSPHGDNPSGDKHSGDNPYGDGSPYYTPEGGRAGAVPPGMPPLGGLGSRLLARIIDWLVLSPAWVSLTVVAALANSRDRTSTTVVAEIGIPMVFFLYEGLMLTLAGGQTVGKKAMRIRVAVLADGSAPVGSTGWIRAAVWTLPEVICCLWLPLDALWCTWDRPYRQCLHDKAAKTVVVNVV
ncbi:putative RDD family membrane protein YckC [Streptacidiphilus sp. MAP12-16]|uniref:RDD family protein n=1 Tax=Streptacidiphilus sp. MAP12-16 TaxID=3156300 RepID=UPI0035148B39